MLIKGNNIKVILEVDGIIVDIKNNTILTNVIPRQILIQKMKPLKTNLTEYSFIDSDKENPDEVNDDDAKDAPLNTHTEYLDLNTTNPLDSAKPVKSINIKQKKKDVKKSVTSEESEDGDLEESESENSVDVENFLKNMTRKK
jgi:hypothetical protein